MNLTVFVTYLINVWVMLSMVVNINHMKYFLGSMIWSLSARSLLSTWEDKDYTHKTMRKKYEHEVEYTIMRHFHKLYVKTNLFTLSYLDAVVTLWFPGLWKENQIEKATMSSGNVADSVCHKNEVYKVRLWVSWVVASVSSAGPREMLSKERWECVASSQAFRPCVTG